MIKYHCDWCGDEIETAGDLWPHRGGAQPEFIKKSETTDHTIGIELIIVTDGDSNQGEYHTSCILRVLAQIEAARKNQE